MVGFNLVIRVEGLSVKAREIVVTAIVLGRLKSSNMYIVQYSTYW